MSDWHSLIGQPGQLSGTAGTATVPSGCVVIALSVHASAGSATFTLFGGPSVAVINGAATLVYAFEHTLWQATAANGGQIVFTNTDHYWIHYVKLGHT